MSEGVFIISNILDVRKIEPEKMIKKLTRIFD